MSSNVVYAIVKAGGRQEKVSVGSVVVVNRLDGEVGDTVELEPVLLVDGEKITSAADGISAKVTAGSCARKKGRRSRSSNTRTKRATASVRVIARS